MLGIVLMAFGQLLHVSLPADGVQIRLVGGNERCSGRVEVYHEQQWGTVCDDDWVMNDAAVVCRQLGCGTALSAPGGAQFGQGTGTIWMDDVGCSGSESSLSECSHRGFGKHNCNHGEDAGAVCSGPLIRLVSEQCRCSGRVEVNHKNQWGTVCDDDWDMNDAAVVCRELGCGTALSAPGVAQFGQGAGEIWMDDVGCSGSESSLSQCSHRGLGKHDCSHGEDAGAVCSGLPIRLVGGRCKCSGRVEVYHKNQWGTVCDDHWDMNDAGVVCRELGCGTALSAPGVAHFGQGTGEIWMDDVGCSGSESSLSQCSHRGLGEHNCKHGEDAGAVCSGGMSQPTLSLSSPHSVLSSGEEVRFRCVAPADLCAPVEFRLHRGGAGSPLAHKSESRGNSVEMGVNNVDSSHQGSYTCLYAVQGNQTLNSSHSNSIAINVVVLQQPTIVLSSPTGEVTGGPQGPEVIEGHSFTITCSTVPQYPGGSFNLIFTGSSVTEAQAAVSHSASFIFSAAELSHLGNYSCVYETTVSGRKFSSPASPLLPLTVTASLILPIVLGASGGLLLVLVPLVLFLLFWKRRHSSGRTQVAKTASNARPMNPYFPKGKASEEEDEQDYENVETLTGNDYEDGIGDEDSGSEADYVNYREPTENEYSEDENIYQNS